MSIGDSLAKCTAVLEILLAGSLALAGPQTPAQTVAKPSLGELAREERAERAKKHLRNVPLITNDNLSSFLGGLGVIGSSSQVGQQAARERAEEQESVEKEKLETLRYELSQAQHRLQLHQRELSVFDKELSENRMQYYPNPNQSLLQQYNREDINKLTDEIYAERQQIAEDQQTVDSLQAALQSAESRWGSLGEGEGPPSPPPITAKPGSPAFWRATLARAREELTTAKEQEKLAGNELRLLKIAQARTLNPNIQAALASAVSAKQDELAAAQNAVQQTQRKVEDIQREMKASGGMHDEN
jgi:DNA repair exonuclease SbcCD ATPase subunit